MLLQDILWCVVIYTMSDLNAHYIYKNLLDILLNIIICDVSIVLTLETCVKFHIFLFLFFIFFIMKKILQHIQLEIVLVHACVVTMLISVLFMLHTHTVKYKYSISKHCTSGFLQYLMKIHVVFGNKLMLRRRDNSLN